MATIVSPALQVPGRYGDEETVSTQMDARSAAAGTSTVKVTEVGPDPVSGAAS